MFLNFSKKYLYFCIFLLIILLCSRETASSLILKIIGGKTSTKGAWPWHAYIATLLQGSKYGVCGGALISPFWVLTAPTCVRTNMSRLRVLIGAWNLSDPNQNTKREVFGVTYIAIHPCYEENSLNGTNLALIRLNAPELKFRPVCLPDDSLLKNNYYEMQWNRVLNGSSLRNCVLTGFGVTSSGEGAAVLQQATFFETSQRKCYNAYKGRVSGDKLCTFGKHDVASCNGDRGGPLVCHTYAHQNCSWYLTAIAIAGSIPCGAGPTIYQAVEPHVPWIKFIMATVPSWSSPSSSSGTIKGRTGCRRTHIRSSIPLYDVANVELF